MKAVTASVHNHNKQEKETKRVIIIIKLKKWCRYRERMDEAIEKRVKLNDVVRMCNIRLREIGVCCFFPFFVYNTTCALSAH